MSRDDHAVQLVEPWRPKRRQHVITVLTTLLQGWISTRKHQYTTAITTMCTESSWAFPESYTTGSCARATGRQQGDKRAPNSTTKMGFCTIIICLCHRMIAITRVYSESLQPFPASCEVIYIRLDYITRHNFSPTRSVILYCITRNNFPLPIIIYS